MTHLKFFIATEKTILLYFSVSCNILWFYYSLPAVNIFNFLLGNNKMKNFIDKYMTCVFLLFIFLAASISSPYSTYKLLRNPKFDGPVKFLTLSDFLNLTKSRTSLSGVMIIIEVRSTCVFYSIHNSYH